MGSVIRKDAAVEDILGDVREAFKNANAKEGAAKERAQELLGPVVALILSVEGQLKIAKGEADPLLAAVAAENDRADDLLGEISDIVWNTVGRPGPGSDPALAVLFPGGIAYYAEGDIAGQPDRMDVLSQLLTSGIHPKLAPEKAAECAARVTAAANALRTKVDAARKPAARLGVLERMSTSVARVGQMQLANLKRALKISGFTEAQIHEIIPDRPASHGKAAPKGGGGGKDGAPG